MNRLGVIVDLTHIPPAASNVANEARAGFSSSTPIFFNREHFELGYRLAVPLITNPIQNFLQQGRAPRNYDVIDNLTWVKGNHLFQFGGTYQHNFNWHQRTDNGGGINYQAVYQLAVAKGAGINVDATVPAAVADAGLDKDWGRDYAATLGIVSIAQQAYTRTGSSLTLNPPLTPAEDRSTIPFYNFYFSDTWHMKPSLTLTYGLGWTLEMPPVEKQGLQVELVDEANHRSIRKPTCIPAKWPHFKAKSTIRRWDSTSYTILRMAESTRMTRITARSAHALPLRGIRVSRKTQSFGADTGESMAG